MFQRRDAAADGTQNTHNTTTHIKHTTPRHTTTTTTSHTHTPYTHRPPGIIKRIFFQEFTFGDAPMRIEGIAVKEADDEIDMEVDVRWCGDANICLGIDLPIGG